MENQNLQALSSLLSSINLVSENTAKELLKSIGCLCLLCGKVTGINSNLATVLINSESYSIKIKLGVTLSVGNIVNIIYPYGRLEDAYVDCIRP